ncbi:hypothetical protein EVAR_40655_1 [Eumeta japonica]|uniref:Uncharacterized protein n=1 Tax=Eumeta variegata TaxID=151549 RepID=A0A4C1X321_EUMVA|nr:hypothetical protein EVAR_40655_1 [Eumeta japonica]
MGHVRALAIKMRDKKPRRRIVGGPLASCQLDPLAKRCNIITRSTLNNHSSIFLPLNSTVVPLAGPVLPINNDKGILEKEVYFWKTGNALAPSLGLQFQPIKKNVDGRRVKSRASHSKRQVSTNPEQSELTNDFFSSFSGNKLLATSLRECVKPWLAHVITTSATTAVTDVRPVLDERRGLKARRTGM